MIARSLGITGHDIMFSSNDTPAADFELANKLVPSSTLTTSATSSSLSVLRGHPQNGQLPL